VSLGFVSTVHCRTSLICAIYCPSMNNHLLPLFHHDGIPCIHYGAGSRSPLYTAVSETDLEEYYHDKQSHQRVKNINRGAFHTDH
jgi:hypothetical protein